MMNFRNVLIGSVASAIAAGVLVSCGGGGGYGGGGGGGTVTYSVGGNVSGATGSVTLKLNGGSDLTVPNGPFTFGTTIAYLSTFNVQVVDAADRCTVANGAGTMGTADVTNVAVTCGAQGAQIVIRSANADGTQAGTGASGTGRGAVVVNPTTREITGGITFSGLTDVPNGAHIHRGDGNIAISLDISVDKTTATIPPGTLISNVAPNDLAELFAGTLYFNVHTPLNGGGEIRGQINLQGGVGAGLASLDNTQETNSSGSTATGRGTIVFDSATGNVLIAYVTHDVANTTVAHVHTGAPGVPGPADVISLIKGTNIYTAPVPSSVAAHLTDINAGNTYFNVHSSNLLCPAPAGSCSGGEIRGQVAIQ